MNKDTSQNKNKKKSNPNNKIKRSLKNKSQIKYKFSPKKKNTSNKKNPKNISKSINYKIKYEESKKIIQNLEMQVLTKEREIINNNNAFQEKIKSISNDMNQKINKKVEEKSKKNIQILEEEKNQIKKYAPQNLSEDILDPIIDIMTIVNNSKHNEKNKDVKNYVQGFDMLITQILNGFSKNGVKIIIPKIGDTFDSNMHQAINASKNHSNKIIEIKKVGFKLHDRVIKEAKVIIGNK